jgi:hypothetical protein
MQSFILFCKSYRKDVLRAKRLIISIDQFNQDRIPFVLSVPQQDLDLFKQEIDWGGFNKNGQYQLITDESIASANPRLEDQKSLDRYYAMPGYLQSAGDQGGGMAITRL